MGKETMPRMWLTSRERHVDTICKKKYKQLLYTTHIPRQLQNDSHYSAKGNFTTRYRLAGAGSGTKATRLVMAATGMICRPAATRGCSR